LVTARRSDDQRLSGFERCPAKAAEAFRKSRRLNVLVISPSRPIAVHATNICHRGNLPRTAILKKATVLLFSGRR
jgi:hypothetical protein